MALDDSESDRLTWGTAQTVGSATQMILTTGGDLHADGDIAAYSATTSDERLKENVKPLEGALGKVLQLEGKTFNWKYRDKDRKKYIGLIAQEVEKVVPEVVKEMELPMYASGSFGNEDRTQYKTIGYQELVPVLIEAVKEQQTQIDDLKREMKEIRDGST